MIYSLLIALLLALLQKRNPLTIINNVELQWPLVIIISFGVQIALAFITIETNEKFEMILMLTFVGIIIGLWKNRNISGVKWIVAGALLNLITLLIHGGLMPVSENALLHTGQEVNSFDSDSRHQLMEPSSPLWILGDWIPLVRYVLSPGDVLVGIGFVVLIVKNSSKWELKVKIQ